AAVRRRKLLKTRRLQPWYTNCNYRRQEVGMKKGLLILSAALMTLAPLSASAAVRGYVVVGPRFYGGFHSPFWGSYWGPYWRGYWGPAYAYPNSGEIKLDTKVK